MRADRKADTLYSKNCDRKPYLSFEEPLVDDDHRFKKIVMFLVPFVHFFAHVNEVALHALQGGGGNESHGKNTQSSPGGEILRCSNCEESICLYTNCSIVHEYTFTNRVVNELYIGMYNFVHGP